MNDISFKKHIFGFDEISRKVLMAAENYEKQFNKKISYLEKDKKRKMFLKDS